MAWAGRPRLAAVGEVTSRPSRGRWSPRTWSNGAQRIARWAIVALATAALVLIPVAVQVRPAGSTTLDASSLAAKLRDSYLVGWSGVVETSGTVQIPQNDSFATLGQLLGESNELRAWWRAPDDYRVDRVRDAGETDVIRHRGTQIRWLFESQTATISPVSTIRLPDAYDVLPPTLARQLLQGAAPADLSTLASARVAGIDAAGVRLTPSDPATSIGRVDLWGDPRTGLPLRVEVYGWGATRPSLTTAFTDVNPVRPAAASTEFVPNEQMTINYDQSVDVAAAANAFAPVDLPATLAGLSSRDGIDPGAVGIYGRGPATLIVLPLRGSVARPLRAQFMTSAAAKESDLGTTLAVGPIGVLLTVRSPAGGGPGRSFLLTGTVTPAFLKVAAAQLLASRQ